jgi:hypothetical protein
LRLNLWFFKNKDDEASIEIVASSTVNAIAQFVIAIGTFFVGSVAGIINTFMTDKSKEKAAKVAEQHKKEQEAAAAARVEEEKQIVASADNVVTAPSTEGPVTGPQTQNI